MQVHLSRENKQLLLSAVNASDAKVFIDGPEELGGINGGLRPMELILTSLASCSAFDILLILQKQKQKVEDFSIIVDGVREKKQFNSPFKSIEMTFSFLGELDIKKVERAVELSVEKYCSVKASLHPDINIKYSVKINE